MLTRFVCYISLLFPDFLNAKSYVLFMNFNDACLACDDMIYTCPALV